MLEFELLTEPSDYLKITTRSKASLETLAVAQIIQKFYGIWIFIALFMGPATGLYPEPDASKQRTRVRKIYVIIYQQTLW